MNHVGKTNRRNRQMKGNHHLRTWLMVFFVVAILLGNKAQVHAAESWDGALEKIDRLYNDFTNLETSIKLGGQQIRVLRKSNNDALKLVNARIQALDQDVIKKLQVEAEQARLKHAPLLQQYSELGKQAAAARKAKNSKVAVLIDLKRNKLKAAVTMARTDINAKKDALTNAKKQAASKAKMVRDVLAAVQTLKKQVTAENKLVAATEKLRSEANKRYKAGVKQGNAIAAMSDMQLVYDQMVKIQAAQHRIYTWEVKITDTIHVAESKLPK